MSEQKELQVGDALYAMSYKTIYAKYTIERVTATQAITGDMRFKRKYASWIRRIGDSGHGFRPTYHIESEKLKKEYRRQNLIREVDSVKMSELDTDTLEKVHALVCEKTL